MLGGSIIKTMFCCGKSVPRHVESSASDVSRLDLAAMFSQRGQDVSVVA